jgi:hypothetical protein
MTRLLVAGGISNLRRFAVLCLTRLLPVFAMLKCEMKYLFYCLFTLHPPPGDLLPVF